MTTLRIAAGTLTAAADQRTATGLLVPYGETCHSNLGSFEVESGAFSIPEDVENTIGLDLEHARETVLGRAVTAAETDQGIVATFRFAKTPEGDQALADIASGKRKHLSAEVKDVIVQAGKAVGGRLFGAALVAKPAFPSATLLAAAGTYTQTDAENDAVKLANQSQVQPDDEVEEITLDDGTAAEKRTHITTDVFDGVTTVTTTVTITPKTQTTDQTDPTIEGDPVPAATIPPTLTASAPKAKTKKLGLAMFTEQVAHAIQQNDRTLLAALSDVKVSGAGSLGDALVPEYLGELWSGRQYARKVIPLIGSGTLTKLSSKGWRWTTKPQVGPWAGNKAEIPSNVPAIEPVEYTVQRFAGGWDIAREFIDFGETEVIDSFFRAATDSYAKQSDDYALAQLLAATTAADAEAVPTDVNPAVGKLVQGALALILDDALPAWALVAPDVYKTLLYTRKDDVLAYLSMSLGLEDGSLASFRIVPHADLPAGQVLVGAKEAATVDELSGSPIRVDALDLLHGGQDSALFGYVRVRTEYPEGLALIKNAPAGA